MFQIKICGFTNLPDAQMAVAAGADAIGLNFYPKSPRCITNEVAAQISAAVPDRVARVGVFVHADLATVQTAITEVGLDWIQLLADDPLHLHPDLPDTVHQLTVFRVRGHNFAPWIDFLRAGDASGRLPQAILLDAYNPTEYGGTGQTLAWKSLPAIDHTAGGLPILLAGGLTPDNVADAIRQAGPRITGVDVASGVESAPGQKDPDRVRSFIHGARVALASSSGTP